MNWLNLCSGGEIGRQAVKELGLPVTNWFSSEIDKFAIKVAKDNHDDINHLGDIKNILKLQPASLKIFFRCKNENEFYRSNCGQSYQHWK